MRVFSKNQILFLREPLRSGHSGSIVYIKRIGTEEREALAIYSARRRLQEGYYEAVLLQQALQDLQRDYLELTTHPLVINT